MKKYIILILLFTQSVAFAQVNIDSLKEVWNNYKNHDTIRLSAIHDVAYTKIEHAQLDSALYFAQEEYSFAQAIENYYWIAQALSIKGYVYKVNGDYDRAIKLNNVSLKYYKKSGKQKGVAKAYSGLGGVYLAKGDLSKSIGFLKESLEINENLNDFLEVAVTFNHLGIAYSDMGDGYKALDYYFKSLALKEKIEAKDISSLFSNIGIIYANQKNYKIANEYFAKSLAANKEGDLRVTASVLNNIAEVNILTNQFSLAKKNLEKSLELMNKIGYKEGEAEVINNFGNLYEKAENYPEALKYYKKSLSKSKAIGFKVGMAINRNKIGIIALKQKNYSEAIKYSLLALTIAEKIEAQRLILWASENLHKSYYAIGDFSKAYIMLESFVKLNSELEKESVKKELILRDYKYKQKKKDTADSVAFSKQQEIKDLKISEQSSELKSKRLQNIMLYGGIFLLIIISSFTIYGYSQKLKANEFITLQKEELENKNDEIERQHNELLKTNDEISKFNLTLESKVKERTSELGKSVEQLRYYHNDLAHNVRAPLATLMGLVNLIQDHRFDSTENEKVLRLLRINTSKMDMVIRGISQNMTEFDEYWQDKMGSDQDEVKST